jgi:hypothetical protein
MTKGDFVVRIRAFARVIVLAGLAAILAALPGSVEAENIWDLEAVDAVGNGTHPKVGADPSDPNNRVVVQGIALNSSAEYLNPNFMWQVYVQGESPDRGGIAPWTGCFFQGGPGSAFWLSEVARLEGASGIHAGDRIQIDGFIANHRGKVNINERHSALPGMDFNVTLVQAGVGMPAPIGIRDLSDCNYFDQTRAGGGELYQAQWCALEYVHLLTSPDETLYPLPNWAGTRTYGWGPGHLMVALNEGDDVDYLAVLLSDMGNFSGPGPNPADLYNITGVFDQEDTTSPFTGEYRLWVKNAGDMYLIPEPGSVCLLAFGAIGLVVRRRRRR